MFFNVLVSLAVIVSILLAIIVLVQNPKDGSLASGFAAGNNIMGVRKTTDFLEKATWTLAIIVVVLSIASAAFVNKSAGVDEATQAIQNIENAMPETEAPAAE